VRVRDTATGVALFFDPKPAGYVSAREEKDAKDSASDGSGSKSSGSSSKKRAERDANPNNNNAAGKEQQRSRWLVEELIVGMKVFGNT